MNGVAPPKVQQWFLLALGAGALALSFVIVQPFLMAIIAALALAILFYPLHHALAARISNRSLAACLSLLLITLLVLLPIAYLVGTLVREAHQIYDWAVASSAAGGGWLEWSQTTMHRLLFWAGIQSGETEKQIRGMLLERWEAAGGMLLRFGRDALANLVSLAFSATITAFSLFFLLRDGDRLKATLEHNLPLAPGTVHRLFTDIGRGVLANVYGIGAVALTQGTLTGLIFFLLGLPSPALWGTIAGFFSMAPLVGPPIVWAPVALWLAANGQYGKAAILAAFGAGVIGLADNFIRPYIVSDQVNLHPLLVFFAILGGVDAFGFLGLFIGPAALSVTVAIFELLRGDPVVQSATSR